MDEQLKKVPPYDPSDPSKILNPIGYPYIIDSDKNVGTVPSKDEMLEAYNEGPKPTEPPPVMDSDWPALVSGGGRTTTNGLYAFIDPANWKFGAYYIKKVGYPDPEVPVWTIVQGSTVYYWGQDTTLPWEVTVWTPAIGTPPAPTVVKQQPTSRSAEKSEEPKKKRKFFNY